MVPAGKRERPAPELVEEDISVNLSRIVRQVGVFRLTFLFWGVGVCSVSTQAYCITEERNMPHLVESNELGSVPPPTVPPAGAQVLEFRRPRHRDRSPSRASQEWGRTDQDLVPLRGQVTEIIDAILAETGPEAGEIREQLRRLVASHPGHPEKALLQHLLILSA